MSPPAAPSGDLIAELRGAFGTAAARIRALPDIELVKLAMGGGAMPELPAVVEEAPKPKSKRVAFTHAKSKVSKATPGVAGQLVGRQAEIFADIKKNGPQRAGELAKTFGVTSGAISGTCVVLIQKGLLESDAGLYRLAGSRQTGAKARKPVRVSDEEEEPAGAGAVRVPAFVAALGLEDDLGPEVEFESVKLSICAPTVPIIGSPARIIAPVLPIRAPVVAPARAVLKQRDSAVFRLPQLEGGEGERRHDCVEYGGCLGRFVKTIGRGTAAQAAHCPDGCDSYEPIPRHVRLGLATAGGSSALSTAAER